MSKLSALLFASLVLSAQTRESRTDALFSEWDLPDSPGCALGVIEAGELVYERAYGMATLEHDVALSSKSVFRTGSLGKQFAAFAVLIAEQQGKLSVDDDVRLHLPEIPVTDPPITVRHLVHHTSGLRDYLTLMGLSGMRDEDFYTEQDILDRLSRQENLNFAPGSEYLYSNTGYFLLSQIIERATGMSLAAFSERYLFAPLGMTNTHFHDDFRRIVKGRAQGYRPRPDGEGFEIDQTTLNMVGDGGVFTTIEDLVRWDRNFDTGEVGGPELARRRLETGRLNDGTTQDYAYGLRISNRNGRSMVSHGGSFVGYRAAMLRHPDDRLSVYVLCNSASASPMPLAEQIADIFLGVETRTGASAAEAEVAASDPETDRFAGTYFDSSTGDIATMSVKEGSLHWDESDALEPAGTEPGTFALGALRVTFEGMAMTAARAGQRPFRYERVETVAPAVETLAQYVGMYRCRELDVVYRVELDPSSTALVLVGPSLRSELSPAFENGFKWRRGSVVFESDAEGRPSRFELAAGRAREFVFERM